MIERLSVRNRTISSLFVDGIDIIEPWGVETADSSGFFSLEDGIGYRHHVLAEDVTFDEKSYRANMRVQMPEGLWELQVDDRIVNGQTVLRKATLLCLNDSRFMDFVLRFRFKKEFIEEACILDDIIRHKSSNRYHQYQADDVKMKGKRFEVQLRGIGADSPGRSAILPAPVTRAI